MWHDSTRNRQGGASGQGPRVAWHRTARRDEDVTLSARLPAHEFANSLVQTGDSLCVRFGKQPGSLPSRRHSTRSECHARLPCPLCPQPLSSGASETCVLPEVSREDEARGEPLTADTAMMQGPRVSADVLRARSPPGPGGHPGAGGAVASAKQTCGPGRPRVVSVIPAAVPGARGHAPRVNSNHGN